MALVDGSQKYQTTLLYRGGSQVQYILTRKKICHFNCLYSCGNTCCNVTVFLLWWVL